MHWNHRHNRKHDNTDKSCFNKNNSFLIKLILILLFTCSAKVHANDSFLVVLDPGHGGQDFGATYKNEEGHVSYEKDFALRIAIQAARALKKKKIRAVLTRQSDKYLDLPERTAIANRLKANVFISIHLNSGQFAEGVETYIFNNSTDESAKRLADHENAVLKDSLANKGNTSDVNLILKDLILGANITKSHQLACLVQDGLVQLIDPEQAKTRNRGVKQAYFYVLLGADMPSILLEVGFLSNAKDRKTFATPEAREKLGEAIADAVVAFKNNVKLSNCKMN